MANDFFRSYYFGNASINILKEMYGYFKNKRYIYSLFLFLLYFIILAFFLIELIITTIYRILLKLLAKTIDIFSSEMEKRTFLEKIGIVIVLAFIIQASYDLTYKYRITNDFFKAFLGITAFTFFIILLLKGAKNNRNNYPTSSESTYYGGVDNYNRAYEVQQAIMDAKYDRMLRIKAEEENQKAYRKRQKEAETIIGNVTGYRKYR